MLVKKRKKEEKKSKTSKPANQENIFFKNFTKKKKETQIN